MKIYISIPITGHDEAKVREHADLTRAMLSRAGHEVVNPFDIYAGEDPSWEDYLCADLRQMFDCDAVYLCEGWQFSQGCKIEAYAASIKGLQLLYEHRPERQPSDPLRLCKSMKDFHSADRLHIAAMVMQGLLTGGFSRGCKETAIDSLDFADALIAAVKEGGSHD